MKIITIFNIYFGFNDLEVFF